MNGQCPHVGSFVWVPGALSKLDIGKVVGCAPGQVSVEYFYSVVHHRQEPVLASEINATQRLASQIRHYREWH